MEDRQQTSSNARGAVAGAANLRDAFARLWMIIVKELIQILRDPRARFVLWGPPVISMMLFGYAATFEIRHVQMAVLDFDHSQESRDLVARFAATRYFALAAKVGTRREIGAMINRGQIVLGIQINSGFARLLRKGETAPLQVILDGTNSNTALIALGYVNQVAARYASDYARDRIGRINPTLLALMPSVELFERPWYNPGLDSRWFFVPGLIATVVMVSVIQLTAFAIVREREIGTLEQLMVTPVRRAEFILGKTVPFFLIGMVDTVLVSVLARVWFAVPLRGNVFLLALGTVPFVLSALAVGLMISGSARTQQQAMVTGFFFLMPSVTFSGFGTPIAAMPLWLQYLTLLNPLRHYIEILRGIYLKDAKLRELEVHIILLTLIALTLLVARIRSKRDIE